MSLKLKLDKLVARFFNPRADTKQALKEIAYTLAEVVEQPKPTLLVEEQSKPTSLDVRIHRLDKDLPLPTRANSTDAGYDVFAAEDVDFKNHEQKLVSLGIIAEAPEGYHFKLYLRSSMAYKRNFLLGNSVGIIDSSYAGPTDVMKALLKYEGPARSKEHVSKGDRIGQLVLAKNVDIMWDEQDNPNFKGESRGGYGSTGK